MMNKLFVFAGLALSANLAFAQATPVGLWKTIDDETKQEKSTVRITDMGGVLSGKVERIADPSKQASVCDQCSDQRKDKPVLGMVIVEGVKKNSEEPYWDGGTIVDPNSGRVYKVRMTPQDGGKSLQVRGYFGPIYRNQVWLRVE